MANELQLQKIISNPKGPLTPKKFSNSSIIERIRVEDEGEIEKKYHLKEVLGKGAFGVVREVVHRESKKKFAMKTVPKDKPGSISIQLLEREVEVLKRVHHDSIIQLEAVYETAKKIYMIMELCTGGELSDELKKRTYFREEDAKAILRKIVEAVVYMHDNDMVHRDLKLENILLATSDPKDAAVKVTDFGLANMKGLPGCEDLMHSKCGTPYYMAPEVIDTKHEYTKMCDVWSLGVIMYSLLCGSFPFYSTNALKLEELVQQGQLTFSEIEWTNVSDAAKDLIKNMLCVDTTDRYTARLILDDPWFTGDKPGKRIRNAMDLMRDMEFESENETANQTAIVVCSPSTTSLTPKQSTEAAKTAPQAAAPQTTAPIPTTPSHTSSTTTTATATATAQTKPAAVAGHTPNTAPNTLHKKVSAQQTTPTKKPPSHLKQLKTRTLSQSAITQPGTSKSGGSLHSSSGVTSPSHRFSVTGSNSIGSGTRQRVSTFSSNTRSQALAQQTGSNLSSPASSYKGSAESIPSSSSKERKMTSPSRTSRTKL